MRFLSLSALALAAVSTISAQELDPTYIQAVIQALTAANLTSLADAAQAAANSTEGAAFLGQLAGSNKTLLAPNNDAFAAVDSSVSSDASLLATILSYHVLNASVLPADIAAAPEHTIVRSLYNNGLLPGNRSVPVVLSSVDNTTTVLGATSNNTVVAGPVAAANFQIYVIDSVIALPPNLTTVATEFVPSLAGLIQQAGLLDTLEGVTGLTVFAPNDAAVAGVAEAVGQLNSTAVQSVLSNHVIAGAAVYSTALTSSNYTSLGGEPFSFISNDTGVYVQSGEAIARIVQSDVITQNGVVHIIDGVLVNAAANPDAASSAASSYSEAATATEDGAIGTATVPASTTGAATGAATNPATSTGAAISIKAVSVVPAVMSIGAMFCGILAGALMI